MGWVCCSARGLRRAVGAAGLLLCVRMGSVAVFQKPALSIVDLGCSGLLRLGVHRRVGRSMGIAWEDTCHPLFGAVPCDMLLRAFIFLYRVSVSLHFFINDWLLKSL